MENSSEPVFSRNVIEFVAVANEFCKYAEHASELKGDELLKILQRILPLMYLKASLLPQPEPYFEDGNEKFVNENDWFTIHDNLREKFGTADDYLVSVHNVPFLLITAIFFDAQGDFSQQIPSLHNKRSRSG